MRLTLYLSLILLVGFIFSCKTQDDSRGKKVTGTSQRPNIVLFVVDDLGTNDAGCYGNPVIKTPALDNLAKDATKFSHAYCTSSSCAASRSVILTGKYNHATGHYGHSHFEHHFSAFDFVKSLPVILDSVGYRTMRYGKLHIAPREVFKFDDYGPKKADHPNRVWKSIDESPYYPHSASEIPPKEMATNLERFLSKEDEEPFFLYFCTWDPHDPFKREGSDTIKPGEVIVPSHLPDVPEIREELAKYYMSAQRADKGLEKIIDILKESGKYNNTIFLFTSDNGRPFYGAKPNLWDPGVRMPFVFRDPFSNRRGDSTDAMINFCDITPTLLDYAGVDVTKYGFHGKSFRELFEGNVTNNYDTIYASHTFHAVQQYYPMRMIKTRQYKLIWNLVHGQPFPHWDVDNLLELVDKHDLKKVGQRPIEDFIQRPAFELYDMENDPDEINNLAYDSEYKDVLQKLKSQLFSFQRRTDDPWKGFEKFIELEEVVERIKEN